MQWLCRRCGYRDVAVRTSSPSGGHADELHPGGDRAELYTRRRETCPDGYFCQYVMRHATYVKKNTRNSAVLGKEKLALARTIDSRKTTSSPRLTNQVGYAFY